MPEHKEKEGDNEYFTHYDSRRWNVDEALNISVKHNLHYSNSALTLYKYYLILSNA